MVILKNLIILSSSFSAPPRPDAHSCPSGNSRSPQNISQNSPEHISQNGTHSDTTPETAHPHKTAETRSLSRRRANYRPSVTAPLRASRCAATPPTTETDSLHRDA